MKKNKTLLIHCLLIFTLLLLAPVSNAQYDGSFAGMYFSRAISAQSDALGMTRSTMPDKAFTVHNNSALLGFQDGYSASYSRSSKLYLVNESNFQYVGLAGRITNRFAAGISHLRFNLMDSDYESISTLALVYKLTDFISLGANARQISIDYSNLSGSSIVPIEYPIKQLYFDVTSGVIIPIEISGTLNSELKMGLTLGNILGQSLEIDGIDMEVELPSVAVLGMQGHVTLPGVESSFFAETISLDAVIELQEVFNYDYFSRLSVGFQVGLNELIFLRGGYYYQNIDDFDDPDSKSAFNEFTYGVGVNIPFSKLLQTQTDIRLSMNYVNMQQPLFTKSNPFDIGRYSTFNISLSITL